MMNSIETFVVIGFVWMATFFASHRAYPAKDT